MEQIEELQGRILSALERIGGGVAALEEKHANRPVPTLEELDMQKHAELLAEIDDEKMANAQLTERLKLLHARLASMEETVRSVEGGADLVALHDEMAQARAEASASVEVAALKAEVARLQQALEGVHNQAASAREALEDDLSEAVAQNAQLKAQLDELASAAPEAVIPAVDAAALEAELNSLRIEAEELRVRAETAEAAAAAAAPVDEGVSAELDQRLSELDSELQALRASNDQLRESNSALRAANADGVGDPSLINTGLVAEVEGLKAARASDQAEVNAVLARLEPLLATAPNLPEGEEA